MHSNLIQLISINHILKHCGSGGIRTHYVKTHVRNGQENVMPLLQCKFCGKKQIHKKELCPAWQKKCSKFHKQNHFAVCCPPDIRKRVNNVDHQEEHSGSSDSDTEYLVNVVKQVSTLEQSNKSHSGPIYVEMIIVDTKQPVELQVDCGAEINVISKRYIPNMTLEESSMTLPMWNNMTTTTIEKTRLIGFARRRTWDTWICGTALWGKKICTRGTVCTLVGRGLPFLPRDCQGWLPVAWAKYDI